MVEATGVIATNSPDYRYHQALLAIRAAWRGWRAYRQRKADPEEEEEEDEPVTR